MPIERGTSVSWRPPGPARLRWWLIASAVTSFFFLATTYVLTGLWIQPDFPACIVWLLLASVQDRTSGSMQSLNTRLYHSTASAVCGELIATVLPSFSTSRAPKHQSTGPAVEIES